MAVQTDVAREFLLFRLFSCTTAKKRASRAGGRGTGRRETRGPGPSAPRAAATRSHVMHPSAREGWPWTRRPLLVHFGSPRTGKTLLASPSGWLRGAGSTIQGGHRHAMPRRRGCGCAGCHRYHCHVAVRRVQPGRRRECSHRPRRWGGRAADPCAGATHSHAGDGGAEPAGLPR